MNTLPLSPMCVGPRGRGAFSAFSTAYAKMTGGCFTNPRGLAGATSAAPPPVPTAYGGPRRAPLNLREIPSQIQATH